MKPIKRIAEFKRKEQKPGKRITAKNNEIKVLEEKSLHREKG